MYLTERLSSEIENISINLIGGNISIRTHSQPELIIDARSMRYIGLIPQMECIENTVHVYKQAIAAFFPQKEKPAFKILVPENKSLTFKMFSGELNINGSYKAITIKMRSGNVLIDGPYFSISEDSSIRVTAGNIVQKQLTQNVHRLERKNKRETLNFIDGTRLYCKVFLGEVSSI